MISISYIYWGLIALFGIIGYLRGWQKEVIAMAGLISSLAALSQFGYVIVTGLSSILGGVADPLADATALARRSFWLQAVFHIFIAFFSYQVVTSIAGQSFGGRLGDRLRAGLERRIVGALVGVINGYLLFGGLWSFLEYRLTQTGYSQLLLGETYPFSPEIIIRPASGSALTLMKYLPLGIIAPNIWLVLFFIAFFVVIVALL